MNGAAWIRCTFVLALLASACTGTDEPGDGAKTQPTSPSATPEAAGPEARGYPLMTSDGDRVLMIGGFDCPSCDPSFSGFDDMWSFDATGTWTNLAPETIPPEADDFGFDIGSRRALLVDIDGETWSYDPASNEWEALEIEIGPTALHGSRMVYDEGSDRMIVFGGDAFSPASMTDETWALDLDGATWEEMQPKERPPIRTYYAMAYDAGSDRVILFGGAGPSIGEPFGDTWAYDFDTDSWERMEPKRSPPARTYAVAAYDAASDRVILYGGSVDEEVATFQDTWAYDYERDTWTKLAPKGPMGVLAWHAMAPSPEGVVLFGGGITRDDYVADTWIFDTQKGTWSPA
jgi:N-acetylneuraminic acid mutarotase